MYSVRSMSVADLHFDPESGVPVVRQITDNLRVMLVEGSLPVGTVLPAVRRLALELDVHFNTVAEAYRVLADEGWLQVSHGRKAVVAERTVPEIASPHWAEEFRTRLRGLVAQTRAMGVPANEIAVELREMAKAVRG
jgi:GntR family transcriptional regulator